MAHAVQIVPGGIQASSILYIQYHGFWLHLISAEDTGHS